jgi:hypothetical protein
LKKIVFAISLCLFNVVSIDSSSAQEWKRYQEIKVATGNQFASPMRSSEYASPEDSYNTVPCTSTPVHPYVVVTAAHCIWGIYGDKSNAYAHNGGVIWIQEPGKAADDKTAKRVRVSQVLRPDSFGDVVNFPTGSIASRDDVAFLVLEKPIVSKVSYKIATLDQIKFAIDNNIKMRVYGYGLNSIAEQSTYYSTPRENRYSVSDQLDPKRIEYDFVKEKLPSTYVHHVGLPQMVLARLPKCGATGTSGSPAVIELDGQEYLIGPGSHSTGWDCPELKDYSKATAETDPNYKYRNIFTHIVVANYLELMNKAISLVKEISEPTVAKVETSKPEAPLATVVDKKVATKVKTTIKCIKGKKVVYVNGYSPKCPKGYTLKKK